MKRRKQGATKGVTNARRKSSAKKQVAPRSVEEFLAKPAAFQDRLTRVAHAVSKMRAEGVSLAKASKEYRLTPETVLRWGRSGLRKGANGRYVARRSDRLLRVMVVLTPDGKQEVAIKDSRQATLIAKHWNSAERHLDTGDSSPIRKFRGQVITDAAGTKLELLSDIAELDRMGNAGVLSFESIYARVA